MSNIKIKNYDTNIKPSDIPYTSLQRSKISQDLESGIIKLIEETEDGNLIIDNNNKKIIEVATDLSNKRYRLENPYITDLCSSLYTMLTTLQAKDLKKIFKKLYVSRSYTRFWIDKHILINIALSNIVNHNNHAKDGTYKVKKYVMSLLEPIFNLKALVPVQTVCLSNLESTSGEKENYVLRTTPIRIISNLVNENTSEELIEVELNGWFFPMELKNKKLIASTSYLHVTPNLSIILALGEDLYLESDEYKQMEKKFSIKSEVARKFIDLIQLSYGQKYNLPNTYSKIQNNKFILEVWSDTLISLYPKSFRIKNKIFKSEFEKVGNLASLYFNLGIEHMNKNESVIGNQFLLRPSKSNFCKFIENSDKVVFTSYID